MKLNYYTLWIENDPEWLDSTIEYVADIVKGHGFIMHDERCFSASEFYQKLENNSRILNKFDLILTDFDLGLGDRGNVLIDLIRSNDVNVFTDIIFYGQDQQAINSVLNEHFIEGVYKSPREIGMFGQKFEKVFESTIKKVQDISMMRGLVISETSEMALRMLKIIKAYLSKIDSNSASQIRSYIFNEIIHENIKSTNKMADKFEQMDTETLLDNRFFDDSKKLRILNKIYTTHKIADFKFYEDYLADIIDTRNELGHCEEIEKDGEIILSTHKGDKIFNHDACVTIRNKIIDHHYRLDIIENFILSKM